MYSVETSQRADDDLERIIGYISKNLNAPKAASDFADSIFNCYDHLENNPYIYEACRDIRLNQEGYRRAVVKNYIVVYMIHEDNKVVHVHAIFHSSQNYVDLI